MTHFLRWICCLGGLGALILLFVSAEFPIRELEEAQQVINEAWDEGASTYSPLVFAKAEEAYQAAEHEIEGQQLRWRWERDYSLAMEMLAWAKVDGHRAIKEAIDAKDQIRAYYGLGNLDGADAVSPQIRNYE